MSVRSCIPVIPSADLNHSLRFWVDGLGLTADRHMYREDKLIGCMVHNEHVCFWLNERPDSPAAPSDFDGIRLYWTPEDLNALRDHLASLSFAVSEIEKRHYGQTEFFVTDDDGHSHCFGVAHN